MFVSVTNSLQVIKNMPTHTPDFSEWTLTFHLEVFNPFCPPHLQNINLLSGTHSQHSIALATSDFLSGFKCFYYPTGIALIPPLPFPLRGHRVYSNSRPPPLCSSSELTDPEKKLEAFREALALLPPSHSETLKFLMAHLKRSEIQSDRREIYNSLIKCLFLLR